jgi:hypothetical protein
MRKSEASGTKKHRFPGVEGWLAEQNKKTQIQIGDVSWDPRMDKKR